LNKGCLAAIDHSRYWHESEVRHLVAHVGYRGKTGQHLLVLSLTGVLADGQSGCKIADLPAD
jgi:hypothetical protein